MARETRHRPTEPIDRAAITDGIPIPAYPPVGTIDRFEVLGRIARGQNAEVFLAQDASEGTHFALKFLAPEHRPDARLGVGLVREAAISQQLVHAHLCEVFEVGRFAHHPYVVMEFVHGVTLLQLQRRMEGHGLPPLVVAHLASAFAEALEYIHHAKLPHGAPLRLVHQQLSPSNAMVSWAGVPKLLDFGIARALPRQTLSEQAIARGYASPEQVRGAAVDARSDVFVLGILLFELLTGRPLYAGRDPAQLRSAIVHDPSPVLSGGAVPEALASITHLALQKDPNQRFGSAGEMAFAIAEYLKDEAALDAQDLSRFLKALFVGQDVREPLAGAPGQRAKRFLALMGDGPASIPPAAPPATWAPGPEAPHDEEDELANHATKILSRHPPARDNATLDDLSPIDGAHPDFGDQTYSDSSLAVENFPEEFSDAFSQRPPRADAERAPISETRTGIPRMELPPQAEAEGGGGSPVAGSPVAGSLVAGSRFTGPQAAARPRDSVPDVGGILRFFGIVALTLAGFVLAALWLLKS